MPGSGGNLRPTSDDITLGREGKDRLRRKGLQHDYFAMWVFEIIVRYLPEEITPDVS
jgi:hypothetical protein